MQDLDGGFFGLKQVFYLFTSILGELIQFDEHFFLDGWFKHQLELECRRIK